MKQGESLRDPANIPHAYSQTSSLNSSSTINSAGVNIAKDNSKRTFGKAISKLKGPKTLAQVVKQEDESRTRMGQSSDAYRSQVIGAQAVRQEYFNLQLPRILRVGFLLSSF